MRKRGQSSVEFSVLISFMFFVFIAFFAVIGNRLVELKNNNDRALLDDLGNYIKNEISLAAGSEDGYYRTFEIPKTLSLNDYSIEIVNFTSPENQYSMLELRYLSLPFNYTFTSRLPVETIGSINQTQSTTVIVTKSNNIIHVEPG